MGCLASAARRQKQNQLNLIDQLLERYLFLLCRPCAELVHPSSCPLCLTCMIVNISNSDRFVLDLT